MKLKNIIYINTDTYHSSLVTSTVGKAMSTVVILTELCGSLARLEVE